LATSARTVLLKNRYVRSDVDIFHLNGDQFGGNEEQRNVFKTTVYQYVLGLVSLFEQDYVRPLMLKELFVNGYEQRFMAVEFWSSGLRLTDNAVAQDSDAFTYFVTMSVPLLVSPRTYLSFSAFSFVPFDMFWSKFIAILLNVPVIYVYSSPGSHNKGERYYMIMFTVAHMLETCYLDSERDKVTWDFTTEGTGKGGQNGNDYRHTNISIPLEYQKVIRDFCKPHIDKIIRKAIIEKCLKSWDKLFTDGFFVMKNFKYSGGQDMTIEWVKTDSSVIWEPQPFSGEFNEWAHVSSIRRIVRRYLSKFQTYNDAYNMDVPDNVVSMDSARRTINNTMVNPMAVFTSLSEEDFGIIASLYANFWMVYRGRYKETWGDNWTFLGALIHFVMSKEENPMYKVQRRDVTVFYNECISRKLFKVDKVTGRTYIRSNDNYTFVYVIPLKLGSYNIKWYLKRDFYLFFKFFDSVYFKPKYLRMLTPQGISILRKLSKFDSKVIDSLFTNVTSYDAAGPADIVV
jgi:hypothetical protein